MARSFLRPGRAGAPEDPSEGDRRSLGDAPNGGGRALEQTEHDLVLDDEHRAEVANALACSRELARAARDPLVERAQVVSAHAGPIALGDEAGVDGPGHVAEGRRAAAPRNQGFPYGSTTGRSPANRPASAVRERTPSLR